MKFDRYETPDHTIYSLLDNFEIKGKVLECACGNKNISSKIPYCVAMDIDPCVYPDIVQDFLTFDEKTFDIIITNPPYSKAIEFITHAIDIVTDNGYVIMLLRINFLESQKRKEFFIRNPLHSLFVLSKRPCFINGRSDSTGYAWFVWQKGKKDTQVNIRFV
jgi:hypothetical protein